MARRVDLGDTRNSATITGTGNYEIPVSGVDTARGCLILDGVGISALDVDLEISPDGSKWVPCPDDSGAVIGSITSTTVVAPIIGCNAPFMRVVVNTFTGTSLVAHVCVRTI